MNGLRNWLFWGLTCISTLSAMGQSTDGVGATVRCSDELADNLRRKFPNGVPGRTIPNDEKVGEVDSAFTYVIPVVVHVMHSFGPERNVTPEQIQSQIDVLNEGFGRYGEGANSSPMGGDVKIKFCLAKVDPYGNPSLGYDYTVTAYADSLDPFTEDTLMKKINQWDPNRYLNIWTVGYIPFGGRSLAGYTYIPEQVAGTAYDGIVIDYKYFGRDAGTAITRGKPEHTKSVTISIFTILGGRQAALFARQARTSAMTPRRFQEKNLQLFRCVQVHKASFSGRLVTALADRWKTTWIIPMTSVSTCLPIARFNGCDPPCCAIGRKW